jgi:hypothetical protein
MQFTGLLLLLILIGTFVLLYGMWLRARRTAQLAALYQRAIEQGMDPRALRFELDEREAGDPQGNLKGWSPGSGPPRCWTGPGARSALP